MAFISPKIIGGITAPTPVGDLGMVEMTQALPLSDVSFEQVCLALASLRTSTAPWFDKEALYDITIMLVG